VYVIDRLCGQWANIPVTTRSTVNVGGQPLDGAVQVFHQDACDFAEDVAMPRDLMAATKMVRQEDAEGLALLDMRVCNTDRHGGNLLLLGSGRQKSLGPIDHGCCLPPWWSLSEVCFDAWSGWPQVRCRPSQSARVRAIAARQAVPQICKDLQRLGLDADSVLTFCICTSFVAIGIGELGLPIDSVANLMTRSSYSDLSWLERQVFEVTQYEGASVSVEKNARGDDILVLHSEPTSDTFAERVLAHLEEAFREEMADACGMAADAPVEEDLSLQRTMSSHHDVRA
jgi:hypothetical protein